MEVHEEGNVLDGDGNSLTKEVALEVLAIFEHDAQRESGTSYEAQFVYQWLLDKIMGASLVNQDYQLVIVNLAQQTQGLRSLMTRERV